LRKKFVGNSTMQTESWGLSRTGRAVQAGTRRMHTHIHAPTPSSAVAALESEGNVEALSTSHPAGRQNKVARRELRPDVLISQCLQLSRVWPAATALGNVAKAGDAVHHSH